MIRKMQIGALILLAISLLAAVDLGYDFFFALVPEINDGLTLRGVLAMYIFGDDGWSLARYLYAFTYSVIIATFIGVLNIIISIVAIKKKDAK